MEHNRSVEPVGKATTAGISSLHDHPSGLPHGLYCSKLHSNNRGDPVVFPAVQMFDSLKLSLPLSYVWSKTSEHHPYGPLGALRFAKYYRWNLQGIPSDSCAHSFSHSHSSLKSSSTTTEQERVADELICTNKIGESMLVKTFYFYTDTES